MIYKSTAILCLLILIPSKNAYITKQTSDCDQLFSQPQKALNTTFLLLQAIYRLSALSLSIKKLFEHLK